MRKSAQEIPTNKRCKNGVWSMNLHQRVFDFLEAHPIIAAVRDETGLTSALSSPVKVVFLLNATLSNIKKRTRQIKEADKLAFIHLEMVTGLSKDTAALEYLQDEVGPAGIITTKPNLLHPAGNLGLLVIQRLFVLDSLAIQTGLKMMHGRRPDFIEVMPGIIPKVIAEIKARCPVPLIAGGMIRSKAEIIALLKVGVVAVSTSREELWKL